MIRVDRFRISDRPYAVDLASLAMPGHYRVNAVWFRRRRGVTVACAGYLWSSLHGAIPPADAREFLTAHTDGRYGGNAVARWDGSNLWAPEMPKPEADRHYELLRPVLDGFPEVPAGYDGWWTFKERP